MTTTNNEVNFFSCAENDYKFFHQDVKNGRVANYLAAMAQNIAERYLKHVIDQEYHPTSGAEEYDKQQNLRAHNLNKLVRCVNDHTSLQLSEDQINEINKANGYYFSTRYPGDEYQNVRKEDIEKCSEAVEACRNAVMDHFHMQTQNIEENKEISVDDMIADARHKAAEINTQQSSQTQKHDSIIH